jgi:hypothetical protein
LRLWGIDSQLDITFAVTPDDLICIYINPNCQYNTVKNKGMTTMYGEKESMADDELLVLFRPFYCRQTLPENMGLQKQ